MPTNSYTKQTPFTVQISRHTDNNDNTTALLATTRNDEPQEVTTGDRAAKVGGQECRRHKSLITSLREGPDA
jgi:hypothetical protein